MQKDAAESGTFAALCQSENATESAIGRDGKRREEMTEEREREVRYGQALTQTHTNSH